MIGGFFVPGIYSEQSAAFASRLAPTGWTHSNVGASLLAKIDNAVSGLRINPIQRPIHRQLGQHNDLLNRQRRIALRPAQVIGKVTG